MSERDDAQKVMRYDAERIVDEVIQERVDKAIYQLIGKRVKEATESLYDYVDNVVADIKTPNSPRGEVRYFGGSSVQRPMNASDIFFQQAGGIQEDLQSRGQWDVLVTDYLTNSSRTALKAGSTVDATSAVSAALNEGYYKIGWPSGVFSFTSTTDLPNAHVIFVDAGFGQSSLTTSSTLTNGIFRQQNRGALFEMRGLTFTGSSIAFNRAANDSPLPFGTEYYEYFIQNCRFLQTAGTYGLQFSGAREGVIQNCYFETCDGVSTSQCINMELRGCVAKNTTYLVNDDASEGLKIVGGTSLGVSKWLNCLSGIGVQVIGVLADYCDQPIILTGCLNTSVKSSYLSSRTVNPVILVQDNAGTHSKEIIIVGNHITQNANLANDICIRLVNTDYAVVADNDIFNYRGDGISYTTCTNLDIHDNIILNRSAVGTASIAAGTDDSTNSIHDNTVAQSFSGITTKNIWNNKGVVTENGGTASITSGNTSVTVTHGLAYTPDPQNIDVIFVTQGANDYGRWWIGNITSTQFTVSVSADPGANPATFYWKARIKT